MQITTINHFCTMGIKKFIIIVIAIFGLQYVANAQKSEKIFTIYLVRHAEKELVAR